MSAIRQRLIVAIVAAGCAATPGARPHEMCAAGHDVAAVTHEAEARTHGSLYDPTTRDPRPRCVNALAFAGTSEVCWTSVVNPTVSHLAEAERHRRTAAEHRAASLALREAEARFCAGLPESDRDMSPLAHREEIAEVNPLAVDVTSGRVTSRRVVGVSMVIRAVPGLTAEWLQRLVDCHLARSAVLGASVAEMRDCPLAVPTATARVASTGSGFAVMIRAEDEGSVAEIRGRAERLISRGTTEPTDRP